LERGGKDAGIRTNYKEEIRRERERQDVITIRRRFRSRARARVGSIGARTLRAGNESIPAWMDEERITARAYEGEDQVDNYTRTRYAESPEDIDERIKAYQENYGATAEERVEAYQEEAREEERESGYRIKAW
jgi:hypothetical protein